MAERYDKDAVRARTDIVSVVEPYVTLKRAGRNLKGLCPFHQEKTPSFTVNPELGTWYCFGSCGEGGDVFKFVQKMDNLSFPEALERLAIRAGVAPERTDGPGGTGYAGAAPTEAGERDRLYKINALALRYFQEMLGRAPVAQEYLRGRGLDFAVQQGFGLGFAPDTWEGLTEFLTRSRASLADAETAGLVGKGERGWFDRMRGRLVFPILDVQERPVAFGGRLIEGDVRPGVPKYWNSPETPVFSKSRTLYGLWRARKSIAASGRVVIVEGYTDVVACHQAGIENVVATLGTSLTEQHVKILAPLASVVLLAFDADGAGLKAAGRAGELFAAQDMDVRVLDLPDGDDPDSLLRAGRRDVFLRAMDEARGLREYRLRRLLRQEGPGGDAAALFRKAVPLVREAASAIEREGYIKLLAPYHPQYGSGASFAEEQIRQDVAGVAQGTLQSPSSSNWRTRFEQKPSVPALTAPAPSAIDRAERHLLRALLSGDPVLASLVRDGLGADEFAGDAARQMAHIWYAHPDAEPATLLAELPDNGLRDQATALVMTADAEPLSPALLEGDIIRLRLRAKQRHLAALKTHIEHVERDGGVVDAQTLRQFNILHVELRSSQAGTGGGRTEALVAAHTFQGDE